MNMRLFFLLWAVTPLTNGLPYGNGYQHLNSIDGDKKAVIQSMPPVDKPVGERSVKTLYQFG